MPIQHFPLSLPSYPRGFHLITEFITDNIPTLQGDGVLMVFIQHTSAGICINENADPTVLEDFETIFNRIVPENQKGLKHIFEGPDDMPAHIKSTITGHSISIPFSQGKLLLGTWQGIYLCEFRNRTTPRSIIASIYQ